MQLCQLRIVQHPHVTCSYYHAAAAAAAAVDGTNNVAPLQAFPYCPNWALSWGSRRRRILREISNAKCDIIALQVKLTTSKRNLKPLVRMIALQFVSSTFENKTPNP